MSNSKRTGEKTDATYTNKNDKWSHLDWETVDVSQSEADNKSSAAAIAASTSNDNEMVDAVFCGLEVIDGSKYEIKRTRLNSSSNQTNDLKDQSEDGLVTTIVSVKNGSKTNKDLSNKNDGENSSQTNQEVRDIESKSTKEQTKTLKRKKKQKQKKSKKKKQESVNDDKEHVATSLTSSSLLSNPDILNIRTSWSASCKNSIWLHPILALGLHEMNYVSPTPIQASTLPASILGRRNIVGAAPTGSGKTLAYALPILQYLLEERDVNDDMKQDESRQSESNEMKSKQENQDERKGLRALICCPTRELSLQVCKEIKTVCKNEISVAVIVGGLSEHKQKRVLDKIRPSILVITPGRLWELISSNEHSHLQDMTKLRFLVIDEADRMISQGNFPQLKQIFTYIKRNSDHLTKSDDEEDDESSESDEEDDRLKHLPGIRGEAKVKMLDMDILNEIENQKNGVRPSPMTDDYEGDEDGADDYSYRSEPEIQEKHEPRQTFVFSATLTLPATNKSGSNKAKGKKKGSNKKNNVDGAIAEILEQAGAVGQTKIVDLTTDGQNTNNINKSGKDSSASEQIQATPQSNTSKRLPPGLSLYEVKCTQKHKDSHCFAYLATTPQGSSGPCLIFCNSIAGVKRVGITLQTLGLPVRMLHAQMSQKARLSALDSFKKNQSRAVLVATDVAARGLDIPSVASVIHYDVPRTVDTFIHRAGRTARGVGDKAVGSSISLVAPGDDERKHMNVCRLLQGTSTNNRFEDAVIDAHLLEKCQEITALATKIVTFEEAEAKVSKKNKWFLEASKEAGIDLDEELLEESMLNGSDKRERMRAHEAIQAKSKLRQLLSRPMRKQQFGKFLDQASIAAAAKMDSQTTSFVPDDNLGKHAKKRAKRK